MSTMNDAIRTYRVTIETPTGKVLIITPPRSIKFSVVRNTLASANTANLTITNLSEENRNSLLKDKFEVSKYFKINIQAGRNYELTGFFQGNIQEGFSYKQNTEWITQLNCYDGMYGIQNGFTAKTVEKNSDIRNMVKSIIKDMPRISSGAIGSDFSGNMPRGQVFIGQTANILKEITKGSYFIDNEVLNIIENDEYIGNTILKIDSDTLLSSPRRREAFLDVTTMFYPKLQVGYLIDLTSSLKIYNGTYKVMGFQHDVEISEASCGTATSILNLYAGAESFRKAVS